MKTTKPKRLKCIQCGKTLAPYFGDRWLAGSIKDIERLYKSEEVRLRELQRVKELHKRFAGRFGYHGNNFFCTVSCGYRWGLDEAILKWDEYLQKKRAAQG